VNEPSSRFGRALPQHPLTIRVRAHVAALIESRDGGCEKAARVITLYNMAVKSADPGSIGLCEAALDDWLVSRAA
jgi:hypothetical protein